MTFTQIQWMITVIYIIAFLICFTTSKQYRIWVLQNRHACLSAELASRMAGDLTKLANKYETEFPDDQSMFLRLHVQADELYELADLMENRK